MAALLDAFAVGFVAASNFCPRLSVANASSKRLGSSYTTRVVPALRFSPSPSVFNFANRRHGKLGNLHTAQWTCTAKATGANANNYSALEFLDPQTGEYKDVGLSAEEEEYGVEVEEEAVNAKNDEELLKSFATAIGLDDHDAVGSLFNKMRTPTSDKIVKQLEEGIGNVEDLLKAMYSGNPEFQELYGKVESLVRMGDVSSAHDIVEANYEALLEQLLEGVFGVEQVAMLDILASLFLLLEDVDAAEQIVEQARELLELIPDTEKEVEDVLEHVATLYFKLKKPSEALPLFTRSLSIRKASSDVPSIVRTMIGLANTYSELQQGDKSIDLYKQILGYVEEALGAEDEDLAAPLMHLGSSLLDEGRLDEAELTIQRAVKLTEKVYGGKDGRYGVAVCVLAQIKSSKGELEEALDCFRKGLQVIEVSKDFSSAEDSSTTTVRIDLAALLTVLGRTQEGQEVLKKANIRDKEGYQYFAFQQVEYLEKLAERYAADGELEEAERVLRRSLQLLNASVGPDAIQVSVVLHLLATLLHAQPDREFEAEPLIRESIRIREKKFGKDHIAVGEAYSYLASILHHQEQDAEAADLMYRVLHIQEKEMGFDHPQLEETLEVLHMLLVNLGRYQETAPIIQRLERMKAQPGYSSFSM